MNVRAGSCAGASLLCYPKVVPQNSWYHRLVHTVSCAGRGCCAGTQLYSCSRSVDVEMSVVTYCDECNYECQYDLVTYTMDPYSVNRGTVGGYE